MQRSSATHPSEPEKSRSRDSDRRLSTVEKRRYLDHRDPEKTRGAKCSEKMEETFGNVEIVTKDKGYYILKSIKED